MSSQVSNHHSPNSALQLPSHCQNCDMPLHGRFCAHCGQDAGTPIRSFRQLLSEFLGEFGNWDGRVWATLLPLMTQPGQLTRAYANGRRVAFVPPVRLYLFISIVAFLIFSMASQSLNFVEVSEATAAERQALLRAQAQIDKTPGAEHVNLNAPMVWDLPFVSDEVNAQLSLKTQRMADNPRQTTNLLLSKAPQMLLLLLPFFALWFWLIYLRQRRFYLEHLILVLHIHAFILLSFLSILALTTLRDSLVAVTWMAWYRDWLVWLEVLLWVWIPLYIWRAMRNYYQQSRVKTAIKYFLSTQIYLVMLSLGLFLTLMISIWQS
ncbi:MAG: DUF3667 domain-containing protein [Firmicutes bacterium]|nr:DUF3667 domain-containing protein [Bacillota bacterium]